MASASIMCIVVIFIGLSMVYGDCTQKEEHKTSSQVWKMMNSEVVAHGVVTSIDPDSDGSNEAYSTVFELRCIYKGGPLDEIIQINRVGYNPNNCLTTNLTKGGKYLVYLKQTGSGQYEQEFQQDLGDSQYVDEIVVLCDATVRYPNGYDASNNKEVCPEEYTYDDCLSKPVSEDVSDQTSPDETTLQQANTHKNEGYGASNNKQLCPEGYTYEDCLSKLVTADASDQSSPDETTMQLAKIHKNEGDDTDEDKSDETAGLSQVKDNNGSVTLTLHMSTLACILLAMIL